MPVVHQVRIEVGCTEQLPVGEESVGALIVRYRFRADRDGDLAVRFLPFSMSGFSAHARIRNLSFRDPATGKRFGPVIPEVADGAAVERNLALFVPAGTETVLEVRGDILPHEMLVPRRAVLTQRMLGSGRLVGQVTRASCSEEEGSGRAESGLPVPDVALRMPAWIADEPDPVDNTL